MPDLKLLRIEEGDNQKVLADKVNSNFSDILTFGGGPYGKIGDSGPQGESGKTGPVGSYGDMGGRGSIWTIGATDPGSTGYINSDFWLNIKAGSGNQIYQYSSSGWSQYGFGILSQDLFRTYPNIPTSAGNSSYTGYTLTSVNPADYTLVLSDNPLAGDSLVANPQYSKLIIAIDGGATGKNLIEFTKSNYASNTSFNTKTPRFYWNTTFSSARYNLAWKNGDSLFFDIPLGELKLSTTSKDVNNSRYRSTGFNLNLSGAQGLSITNIGNFTINTASTGNLLLSNGNIKYFTTTAGNYYEMPITFNFTNALNSALPPLWLESTKSDVDNLWHRSEVTSSRVSRLFLAYTSSEAIFDVKANGEVWYNKRINSIQSVQPVTYTVAGSVSVSGGTLSGVQWYTSIPGAVYSGGTSTERINCNNGTDFVISPSAYGPSSQVGICLWTPANGGGSSNPNNNGGWLNMLGDHEAINFRVRTDSETKFIRFLGLNTSSTFNVAPNDPSGSFQAIDLTGTINVGASHIDFTIMNLDQGASVASSVRWFKVYYSAYGGNIIGNRCGVMYTTGSTAI
jgi:hypothetical protein